MEKRRTAEWDDLIHFVEASLNGTYHSVLQNTPFYIYHGQDYTIPYNTIFTQRDILNFDSDGKHDCDIIANNLRNAFDFVAQCNLCAVTERNEKQKDIREHGFIVGDLILLRNETKAGPLLRKLNVRYKGPFRVIKVLSAQNILISDIQNKGRNQTVNVSRCKKCHSLPESFPHIDVVFDYFESDELSDIQNSHQSPNVDLVENNSFHSTNADISDGGQMLNIDNFGNLSNCQVHEPQECIHSKKHLRSRHDCEYCESKFT